MDFREIAFYIAQEYAGKMLQNVNFNFVLRVGDSVGKQLQLL